MQMTLRIAVLLALCWPASLVAQENLPASDDKAQLQAKLTGTNVAAKLTALAKV